ncbi:MAG: hypothetical protein HOQ05_03205, partial [Corynebacteriales bacterium]|nr:hypothetical protein [Mycobacteriales bacterium]
MTETAQDPAWTTCPRCAHAQTADQQRCARCQLSLTDPLTIRLGELNVSVHEIDAQLRAIDTTPKPGDELYQQKYTLLGQRAYAMRERAALLQHIDDATWRSQSHASQASVSANPHPQAKADFGAPAAGTSPAMVQNLLLALGGVLLSAAAIAFTIFAWGNFGVEGRALILAAVTALTLLAPWQLHRKHFTATAETVLVLGLFLLGLDGYAAWQVGWNGPLTAAGHTGFTLIAVAVVGCGYSLLIPLRSPLPIGVVSAHMAVPFLAIGLTAEPMVFAAACLLVACLDVAFAATSRIPSPIHPMLLFSAALAGISALCVSAVSLADGSQFWSAVLVIAAIAALAVASAAFLTEDTALKHIALSGAVVIWWLDASAIAA